MKAIVATITGSVNYGAPTITPTDRFLVSTATLPEEPVYNLKAIKP
jgi:hypothetical protein